MSIMTTENFAGSAKPNAFSFWASDVTGTNQMNVRDILPGTLAGDVAQALAARMELPRDVPWSLRHDRDGSYLRDDQGIREQLNEDEEPRLTLTPRTHLG